MIDKPRELSRGPKTDFSGYLGTIILCSLSSQLDPLLIASCIPQRSICCQPTSVASIPWLRRVYQWLGWRPLPPWERVSSPFARRRFWRSFDRLGVKENARTAWLIFPSGHPQEGWEADPISEDLESEIRKRFGTLEIRYARVRGMLGSLFSARRFGGPLAGRITLWQVLQIICQNAIFFLPKRTIIVEFSRERLAPAREDARPVSYGLWRRRSWVEKREEMQETVFSKLAQMANRNVLDIHPEQNLYEDLLLDSLDITELTIWIRETFDRFIPFEKLRTVEDVVRMIEDPSTAVTNQEAFDEKKSLAWKQGRRAPHEPHGQTIPEAFFSLCDEQASAMACADPMDAVSYQRLKSMVVGLVGSLRDIPGERVGILLPGSIQCNALVLALLLAGKVPVPINWTVGIRHVERVVELAGLQTIVSAEPFLERLRIDLPSFIEQKVLLIEELVFALSPRQKQEALALSRQGSAAILRHFRYTKGPKDTAVLVFTSGTESDPKGVPLSHQNLLGNQRSLFSAMPLVKEDVILGMLPVFHIYGLSLANLWPLVAGCRVVYSPNFLDLAEVARMIRSWGVTILATTPTFLRALLQSAETEDLRTIRLFFVGAEPAPEDLFEKVGRLPQKPLLVEGYGITECSPCLTLNRLTGGRKGVGFALPGVDLRVVDSESHEKVRRGKRGIVCARGDNVFSGYLDHKTNPFIQVEGAFWYNTGDLGHLDEEGALVLEGRLSRTVKIGGELVALQAIESSLQERLPLASLAIIAQEDQGRPKLILYLTQPVDLATVNLWIKEAGFGPLFRLQEVRVLAEMPRLGSGKIDYRALQL